VPPWRLGWGTNRLLLGAVVIELAALVGFLAIGPLADLLEHAMPPWPALLVAVGAAAAVLTADATHKAARARRRALGMSGP
jgi:hypothetical protein